MSTSSTISNLQQALNCAGKCDCCSNLQSQINQLKAEISALKNQNSNVDEYAIAQRVLNQLEPRLSRFATKSDVASAFRAIAEVSRW